jgi:hypothetical protein
MKLEPVKKTKLPKYAAAFVTAAASAALLSGCGLIDSVFEDIRRSASGGIFPTVTEEFYRNESSQNGTDAAQTENGTNASSEEVLQ